MMLTICRLTTFNVEKLQLLFTTTRREENKQLVVWTNVEQQMTARGSGAKI